MDKKISDCDKADFQAAINNSNSIKKAIEFLGFKCNGYTRKIWKEKIIEKEYL
jgi:hypothetical protein